MEYIEKTTQPPFLKLVIVAECGCCASLHGQKVYPVLYLYSDLRKSRTLYNEGGGGFLEFL